MEIIQSAADYVLALNRDQEAVRCRERDIRGFARTGTFLGSQLQECERSWHVTCGHCREKTFMAAKVRMLKLLGEMRGFAHIGNRQPPSRSPGLFVAQLRSHIAQSRMPRRRLNIQMDAQDHPDAARPVPIVHVRQDARSSTSLQAP